MKGELLRFEDLRVGMKVSDEEGKPLIVRECDDIHNVYLSYRGHTALHCLVEDCTEPIDINGEIIYSPQYDPLYEFIKPKKCSNG